MDFGLSNYVSNKNNPLYKCGTPGFIAPEIFQHSQTSSFSSSRFCNKCDVFSAGVILYILATGTFPFQGKNIKETIEKNKTGIVGIF